MRQTFQNNSIEEILGLSNEKTKQFCIVFKQYWKSNGPHFPPNSIGLIRDYNQSGDRIQSFCYINGAAVYIEEDFSKENITIKIGGEESNRKTAKHTLTEMTGVDLN